MGLLDKNTAPTRGSTTLPEMTISTEYAKFQCFEKIQAK